MTYGFEKLIQRTVIKGELRAETQLYIGAAASSAFGPDNPFITTVRGGKRVPYIPGSSIKGVIRARLEGLAGADGEDICPHAGTEGECDCLACRIFGSQSQASHVRIFDCYPIGEVRFETKPGVRIDRVTGTVYPGAFFTWQVVPAGTRFEFKMIIENVPKDSKEMRYIAAILRQLTSEGLQIGGKKSIGLGLVRLVNAKAYTYSAEDILKGRKPEGVSIEGFLEEIGCAGPS